ncbi:hypothetical protein LG299_00365 [Microbacterium lacus]|uniref:hypothetical protein n=1 Tax=Microbacterium lacus TaxID=415217 RepID=UPI00384DD1F7
MLALRQAHPAEPDDRGSTLVVVLVVMLVLTTLGLTVAAIVTNTTGMLVDNRTTAESRAAADAGLAEAVAEAKRTNEFCDLALSGSSPTFEVTSTCPEGEDTVVFTSVGHGAAAGVTTVEARFEYATESSGLAGAAELVFFNSSGSNVYFTNHVLAHADSSLATVLFPGGGGLECKTVVPANVLIVGPFRGQAGCTIEGSVFAGGAGTPPQTVKEKGTSYPVAAFLNNSDVIEGDLVARGNVHLGGTSRIDGTVTMPTGSLLFVNGASQGSPTSNSRVSGGAGGSILYDPALVAPDFPTWYEFAYSSATDWPGYDKLVLSATSTPYTCSTFKGSGTTFWTSYVNGLTKNTVVDARACAGGWDTDQGATSTASLGVDLVLLGNAFTLGKLTLTPKSGTSPRAWFVIPDATNDGKATCPAADSTSNWDYKIETDATINVTVESMMYTPCTIRVGAGGTWTGAMYAGDLDDGGDVNIYPALMALPGQWGSGSNGGSGGGSGTGVTTLGNLVSQRDVP